MSDGPLGSRAGRDPSGASRPSIAEAGLLESQLAQLFESMRPIARSDTATVFSAVQRSTRRIIAIKVVPVPPGLSSEAIAAEVSIHAEVSAHPNVATLLDAGQTTNGLLWLSLEYVPTSLQARLERHSVGATDLFRIATELTAAVSWVHSRGVVHCDLKPSNVLLTADGGVRLADFGIAQHAGETPPTLDPSRGTLHYLAPEVLEGARPDAAADIWGIGATLWAAAHGRSPFADAERPWAAMVNTSLLGMPEWNPPAEFTGREAERLREVVELCTRADPAARPTAVELAGLLARPLRQITVPVGVVAQRRTTAWAAVALAATLVIGMAAVTLRNSGRSVPGLLNTTTKEWCAAADKADRGIASSLDRATVVLEQGGYTAPAMRAALGGLSDGVARATAPWAGFVAVEPRFEGKAKYLDQRQMRDLMVAETVTYLATGQFIGSGTGTTSQRTLASLPKGIAHTAGALDEVSEMTRTACGTDGVSWRGPQIQLADAVRRSLEGPGTPFFADPVAAARALDADLFATVIEVQGGYFNRLVKQHPDWLIAVMDTEHGSPAVVDMLLTTGAQQFRELALESPDIARSLLGEHDAIGIKLTTTLPESDQDEFRARLRQKAAE